MRPLNIFKPWAKKRQKLENDELSCYCVSRLIGTTSPLEANIPSNPFHSGTNNNNNNNNNNENGNPVYEVDDDGRPREHIALQRRELAWNFS